MEHRIVLAVFAKERNIFTEIHVLKVVSDKASVAPLNALAEHLDHIFRVDIVHFCNFRFYHAEVKAILLYDTAFRGLDKLDQQVDFFAVRDLAPHSFDSLRCIELG